MGCNISSQEGSIHPGVPTNSEGFVYITEAPQCKSKTNNGERTKVSAGSRIVREMEKDKKITQIVPSPERQLAQDCLRKGQIFKDPAFPASNRSLHGGTGHEDFKGIKFKNWKPLHEVYENPQIFVDGTSAPDVRQGRLGSCYLLAGLSALAETPKRILEVFLMKETNSAKFYSVKILYRGVWREVIVDDYIPMVDEEGQEDVAFSYGTDEQVWMMLLEKAWAKLYGNYGKVIGGFGDQSLHDFTGAPVETVEIGTTTKSKDEMWSMLVEGTSWNFPMVCSTASDTGKDVDKKGYVMGHAFTLLGAFEVKLNNGKTKKLVKIRNPFGSDEQRGAWNDEDACWKNVNEGEKSRLGFFKDSDDGIFFCAFEDFTKHFSDFTIANVYDSFSYLSCTQAGRSKGYFEVIVEKEGMVSFIVDQTPYRVTGGDFEYRDTIILLAGPNGIEYFVGEQKNDRSVSITQILTPGRYIVYANILENGMKKMNDDVTLGCYCEFPCQINTIAKPQNFKTNFFLNHAQTLQADYEEEEGNTNEEVEKDLWIAYRTIGGYQYLYISNNTESSYRFKFTANKKNGKEGLVPSEEIYGKSKWEDVLAPGESKIYVCGSNTKSSEGFVEYEYEEL